MTDTQSPTAAEFISLMRSADPAQLEADRAAAWNSSREDPTVTDTQPLPAALLDQLIDTGNKALNDYYHERACACSTWPEKCASWKSPGDMFFGYWDTDAFAIALPDIIAAYEKTKES